MLISVLDCGWRFDRDGKHFFCDMHRKVLMRGKECDRISLQYYEEKNPRQRLFCSLCGTKEDEASGELLAFQSGRRQTTVHLNCIKYTSLVDTTEIAESRMENEFQNVFEAIEVSKVCSSCQNCGATVCCAHLGCDRILHYPCAVKSNWSFERNGKSFKCPLHRSKVAKAVVESSLSKDVPSKNGGVTLQHNLLTRFGAKINVQREDVPGNHDIGGSAAPAPSQSLLDEVIDFESDSDESLPGEDARGAEVMDIPLSTDVAGPKQLVRLERRSREEFWDISLKFDRIRGLNVVSVDSVPPDASDLFSLRKGDILVSINGAKVGSEGLETLRDILFRMKQEIDMMLQVIRK
jgi:hypothetical protein